MNKYLVRLSGVDSNSNVTTITTAVIAPEAVFTEALEKFSKHYNLDQVEVVEFRKVGIVEVQPEVVAEETLVEGSPETTNTEDDDMAKKKTATKKTATKRKTTAKKAAPKKTSSKKSV